MANIDVYLQKIKEAVYGEEVRGSIHDAIHAMNEESSEAIRFASAAKDSAQSYANAAQASASTASQKAAEVASSVSAVKESESSAAKAAAASKASETAAKASETAASQKAAEAANSEHSAALSSAEAAASALSAQQYSGKPPKPQDGTWQIWDAAQQQYVDSGIGCELEGPAGNSISDICLTSGDHMPGTTDIYTITMTDGTEFSISVYNGRNGTGAGDLRGIEFDLVLPQADWLNGETTIEDNRLIALKTYKYFVRADESSRAKYLECGIRPKDITSTGFITFQCGAAPETDLTVNVIRLELSVNGE